MRCTICGSFTATKTWRGSNEEVLNLCEICFDFVRMSARVSRRQYEVWRQEKRL